MVLFVSTFLVIFKWVKLNFYLQMVFRRMKWFIVVVMQKRKNAEDDKERRK